MDSNRAMEKNLAIIAADDNALEPLFAPTGRLRRQRGLSRGDVIQTFQYAFELIGGTPRLALWADANQTEFYKIYGRLLPSSNSQELDGPQEMIVKHVLAPPQYDASQSNRAHLPAPDDIPALPQPSAEVGTAGRAQARRKDRGDDK